MPTMVPAMPVGVTKFAFAALDAFRVGGVCQNIFVEIPAFVFVEGDEQVDELVVDILGAAIGQRHAPAGDHDDAEQAGRNVLQFVGV